MKTFKTFALSLALVAFLSMTAFGQVIMTQTTLSSNLDSSATILGVVSATGIIVPGFNVPNQATGNQIVLVIDSEALNVVGVSGTTITVTRGSNATKASSHLSGSTVWVAPPLYLSRNIPAGSCNTNNLLVLPRLVVSGTETVENGATYDCLGVAPNGQWVQTNAIGSAALGTVVASVAGVITPTGTIFHVSGALAITGITLPNGWAAGVSLYIIPDGTFTWTTATNIAIAGTAVVNKMLIMTWSGTKWIPSYLS